MRFIVFLMLCLVVSNEALGQPMTSDGEYGEAFNREYMPPIEFDPSLFEMPLEGAYDIFSRTAAYEFSAVRYLRRGYDFASEAYAVNGMDLFEPLSGRVNYSVLSALRRVNRSERYSSGMAIGDVMLGGLCGTTHYSLAPSQVKAGNSVALFSSDRRYRWGLKASSAGEFSRKGWYYSLSVGRRWGRDGHIRGVFTDETTGMVAVERRWNPRHSLSMVGLVAPASQGLRSAAVQECFELTGDRLYNPSWGYYDGKEFNSRVRKNVQPLVLLFYRWEPSDRTQFEMSMSLLAGRSSYSGLSWFEAQNPYPDYYRVMPGFYTDPEIGALVRERWLVGDSRYTQMNWEEMVYQNKAARGPATYVLEDRVERKRNWQWGVEMVHHFNDRLSLGATLRLRRDHTLNFKEAADLLGGEWFEDVDQYLIDDEFYGDRRMNNVRTPGRRVTQGERFGYCYDMYLSRYDLSAQLICRNDRFRYGIGVEMASERFYRSGHYEKELFPDEASFGDSRRLDFPEYRVKFAAGYSFSPRHGVDLTVMAAEQAPAVDRVFLSPMYNNYTVNDPTTMGVMGAELSYRLSLPNLRLKMTGFYTRTRRETDVYRYYDDLTSLFCDMSLSGMDKLFYGIELGAEIRLASRFYLTMAASAGEYVYDSNPLVQIVTDAEHSDVVTDGRSLLSGYRIGNTPQRVACAQLQYDGARGWLATLSLSWMGDRAVTPNPLRRMPRVLTMCTSPEMFAAFADQESLPDAFTVGLFVLKSFRIGSHSFTCMASLSNLLGRSDIVYSAYEPMRILKTGTVTNRSYQPFVSRYQYAYARTYYVSVGYKF